MANDNDLMSKEWCDVIFKGKNKRYGAYKIRTTSSDRYLIALLTTFFIVSLIAFLPMVRSAIGVNIKSKVFTESVVLADLKELEEPKEEEKESMLHQQEAPPPPIKVTPLKRERPKEGVRYGIEGGKPEGADNVEEIKGKQPESPELNMNALYNGRKTGKGQGHGEGAETGPGDLGIKGGDPNSTYYGGVAGGRGVSYDLNGRSSLSLAKPSYSSKDQGTIVVKIWVNRQGNVVKAQAGERKTTIYDQQLWKLAEKAALRSSFTASPNAPELQTGTITYKFIIGG